MDEVIGWLRAENIRLVNIENAGLHLKGKVGRGMLVGNR